ncbi:SAM-dependent methyltransferase [Spirillospora sp. NPDC047279]|uniref:SAM-dependent methyltransferase n=1 Tax=Spirillospora sp. NPDC047279 TaxID=3155478 RepID=UPI0033EEAC3E
MSEPTESPWRLPSTGEIETVVPPEIDTAKPHTARIYDYMLGGKDNFEADRQVAGQVLKAIPDMRNTLRLNRQFLRRAVRYSVRRGVSQFLDVGTGIPTAGNTHEVAQAMDPAARIAYVDHDPIVLAHARALMTGDDRGRTTFVQADLREPEAILAAPEIREVLDLTAPVTLMLVSILHFIQDDEDPHGLARRLVDALAPGSYLVLSHASLDPNPEQGAEGAAQWKNASSTMTMRPYGEILRMFDGLELIEPGLTTDWNPDDEPDEPGLSLANVWGYAGVAIKR